MANIPGTGMGSYLQFAEEVGGYGTTPGAADARVELLSADPKLNLSTLKAPAIVVNQAGRVKVSPGPQFVTLSFKALASYTAVERLIRLMLPTYSYSSGSKTHTMKEISAGTPSLRSCTYEHNMGGIPANKVTRMPGGYIMKLGFSIEAAAAESGFGTLDFDVACKDLVPNTTPMTAGAYPASQPISFQDFIAASSEDGAGAVTADKVWKSLKIEATIPHAQDRNYMGPLMNMPPVRAGHLDVHWTIVREWNDQALLAAAKANTPTTPIKAMFQQGATFDGTNKRTLVLQSRSVVPAATPDPQDGLGVIYQTIEYDAAYDGTDASTLLVTVTNENAALP